MVTPLTVLVWVQELNENGLITGTPLRVNVDVLVFVPLPVWWLVLVTFTVVLFLTTLVVLTWLVMWLKPAALTGAASEATLTNTNAAVAKNAFISSLSLL